MDNAASTVNLFVVIPVLNRWEQTRACLNALLGGCFTDFSIIVVDHGSTDGTREGLQRDFPKVIRVPGTTDMWWSAATNAGVSRAMAEGADAIILLNNDCNVNHDAVATLINLHQRDPEAIIAPVQRNLHSGKVLTSKTTTCFLLGFPTLLLPVKIPYRPDSLEMTNVSLIMGGRGTLVPVSVFNTVGLFNDRQLPHYGADHDFYLRARKQGFRLLIANGALVDVDETTTTMSGRLADMPLGKFIQSLRDRRSHRNIRELSELFRLHYPLPGLYPIGVFLNLLRYSLVYTLSRLTRLMGLRRASE